MLRTQKFRTHGHSDNVKTVYPPTNTVFWGYKYVNTLFKAGLRVPACLQWHKAAQVTTQLMSIIVFANMDSTNPLLPKSETLSI